MDRCGSSFTAGAKVSLPVRQHLKVSKFPHMCKCFNVFNIQYFDMLKVLICLANPNIMLTLRMSS